MSDKSDRADAKADAKTAADRKAKHAHKGHGEHKTLPFIRAGGQLVNLAHVVSVSLPVDGDPKHPLTLTLASGTNLQLAGDDADAVLAALGDCCDVD